MTDGRITPRGLVRGAAAWLLAVGLTGLAACTNNTPDTDESPTVAPMTSLVVGATVEPPTFDITQTSAAAVPQLLLYNVYETLLKVDDAGVIQPLLATEYSLSDDRLTYTFKLDPRARFASGTAVDAAAVKASIERLQGSPNTVISTPLDLVAAVTEVDPQTVAIRLTRPSNSWLYDMTSSAGIVIDPATTDLAAQPAGSGPYQFSNQVVGDRITLTKNPLYWGTTPVFDDVTFRYFADPSAMTFALQTGDIDLTSNLTTPSSISQFVADPKLSVIEGTTTGEVVLGFNHQRPALQNLALRQAINYAIDRAGLLATVWADKGQLIGSMVAPSDPYYEDLSQTYPYDPERAKELLASAGATDLKLTLRVASDLPYAPPAAQYIQSQLAAVGITVTVEEIDWNRWLGEVFTDGDYDLTIVAHLEPRDIVSFANPDYYWHYNNAAFNEDFTAADQGSPDQFVAGMKQAARILADDAAADWLFLMPQLVVAKADLTGVPVNASSLSFDITQIRPKG
jgi:peptide/nickel transport system substrate-binding protein